VHVVAVGKASAAMLEGAADALGTSLACGLVVAPEGGCRGLAGAVPGVECLEAAHPVPDARSLAAGERLVGFLEGLPPGGQVLLLLSGGASSLVERPAEAVGLDVLRAATLWLLASGLPIGAMNRVRKALSRIKGGRLAAHLRGRPVLALVVSDVPGDLLSDVGSGLLVAHGKEDLRVDGLGLPAWLLELVSQSPALAPPEAFASVRHVVVASARQARATVSHRARRSGLRVFRHESLLVGDALEVGRALAQALGMSPPGLHVWSGETTVRLPPSPGRGGRCQSLALAAALALADRPDVVLLAAGTDGRDGSGEAAGALIDGGTVARGERAGLSGADCLARADAGTFLSASGDLVDTGATATNVMDLVLGLRVGAPPP
jgi:hydroxypyruvate reductase